MLQPRYKKVLRELSVDGSKTVILVLAVAVGVFALGTIVGAYAVLTKEMARNYLGTAPASATVRLQRDSVDTEQVAQVRGLPGVGAAERRTTVLARMQVGQDWYPLLLFVIDDFDAMQMNRLVSESGAWPPPTGSMLVERTALQVMRAAPGGNVIVKTPHGQARAVPIAGVVHDAGLAPAWQEQEGYAYITAATLQALGETPRFDELRLRVADDRADIAVIEQTAQAVAAGFENAGRPVREVEVPPPRRHPHQGQMNAVLSLFTAFSVMTLVLSSILVATSIATLMIRQIREIGVMKTLGASARQVASLYLAQIVALSVVALAVALPLSGHAAALLVTQVARLLNLTIVASGLPAWVYGLEVIAGIGIPLLAALLPVLRGSRISVHAALNNYGVAAVQPVTGRVAAWLARLRCASDIGTLALRNVLRQRGRLWMTLGLLAAGGGLFMTALNVSQAWDVNLRKIFDYRHYDLEVRLTHPVDVQSLVQRLRAAPGVRAVEAWNEVPTTWIKHGVRDVVHVYPDQRHGSFLLAALPPASPMVRFRVLQGHWLAADAADEVVLNRNAQAQVPGVRLGDSVELSVEGRATRWRVAGIVEDIGTPSAVAYVADTAYAPYAGAPGAHNSLRIALTERDPDVVARTLRRVDAMLADTRAPVSYTLPMSMLHNAVADHMTVLVSTLLAMAVLMACVGAFGLVSVMNMNIAERTRELGVLRAVGATPGTIVRLLLAEGMLMSGMSLLFAWLASLLFSALLGVVIGGMAFRTPLPLVIAWWGVLAWIVLLALVGVGATLYPAWRAGRMSTRAALAYQ